MTRIRIRRITIRFIVKVKFPQYKEFVLVYLNVKLESSININKHEVMKRQVDKTLHNKNKYNSFKCMYSYLLYAMTMEIFCNGVQIVCCTGGQGMAMLSHSCFLLHLFSLQVVRKMEILQSSAIFTQRTTTFHRYPLFLL